MSAAVARGTHRLTDAPPACVLVRSRHPEDRLSECDYDQYVILGAGLDSFAWRHPEAVGALGVFEVDHPASQAWKRERAAAIGLPIRPGHVFAPVDFEAQTLREALDAAKFDWSRKALFAWVGTTMYLTRARAARRRASHPRVSRPSFELAPKPSP